MKKQSNVVEDVWLETGLGEGIRHPLTYLMEACDDIAYSVLDAEDIIKKGLASFYDLINHLTIKSLGCSITKDLVEKVTKKNQDFIKEDLSPAELNDITMQMFRVYAISALITSVINTFTSNLDDYLSPTKPMKDLMSQCASKNLCEALKSFDKKWGYSNKNVLKLELKGHNFIQSLMDMLWVGIHGRLDKSKDSMTPFGKYAYQRISENYRRVFESNENPMDTPYKEAQLLTDAISGMTDGYLVKLHDELKSLYDTENLNAKRAGN